MIVNIFEIIYTLFLVRLLKNEFKIYSVRIILCLQIILVLYFVYYNKCLFKCERNMKEGVCHKCEYIKYLKPISLMPILQHGQS